MSVREWWRRLRHREPALAAEDVEAKTREAAKPKGNVDPLESKPRPKRKPKPKT